MSATSPRRPKRSGLGKGLGALIPEAEEVETASPERPVDVLFPDRAQKRSDSSNGSLRGGSARDLLSPRPRNVSRETKLRGGGDDVSRETATNDLVAVPGASFAMLPVSQIVPNTKQPRQVFDEDELAELSESIKQVGVLQPVVVRPLSRSLKGRPGSRYELIMGERRLRASELAGLEDIPAIVRVVDDKDLLRDALLENLHRAELNPLEEAAAYEQLMSDFGCTQEELSERIARSRPQITNTLRLLKLPPSVQRRVAAGVLSAGHARALLGLESTDQMERLAARITAEGLSVRATEELVRALKGERPSSRRSSAPRELSPLATQVADSMADLLDTRVTVSEGKKSGKIVITFADAEDLERIARVLTDPEL